MNREIKFRIWANYLNRFYTKEYCGEEVYVDENHIYEPDTCQQVWQQYTGVKDKNGKEIYEGDIIQFSDLRYEILFDQFQWVAVCPYYNKYHHPKINPFRSCMNGEVVGNIFENPELLK